MTIGAALFIQQSYAQQAELETTVVDTESDFLGTITLGESKRAVQTDTAVAITTIDQVEITDRQATTVGELLDSVPGVSLNGGTTPNGSGINIRGFGTNTTFGTDQKVAIVIDGATTGSEEIYRLGTQLFTDPHLYKSVNVIRGTVGSFEYGTGIVGGTVKLDTKDASDLTGGEPGLAGGLTGGYFENGDAYNVGGTFAYQSRNNLEILVNAAFRTQNEQKDGAGEVIPGTEFSGLPSILAKASYATGNHAFSLGVNHTESSDLDVPYESFSGLTGSFGNVDRDTQNTVVSAFYNYSPQNLAWVNVEAGVTYSNQEIEQEYVEGSSICEADNGMACGFPFTPGGFAVVNADHQFEITKLSFKNRPFVEIGSTAHNFVMGAEVQLRERQDASAAPGGEDTRFALYVIDEIEFTDSFTLTPAIRYETSDLEGDPIDFEGNVREGEVNFSTSALVGALSARYEFNNGIAVFTSWAHTENLPIIDDLENPVLIELSEQADTIEFGGSYETSLSSSESALALKANYYETDVTDLTTVRGVEGVELSGVELEASLALENGLYMDLNANIVDGDEISSEGVRLEWRQLAQNTLQTTVGWRFKESFDTSMELVHLAGDDRSVISRATGLSVQGPSVGGATLFNLRATYAPNFGALENTEFRLGIENLGDKVSSPLLSLRNNVGRNVKLSVTHSF